MLKTNVPDVYLFDMLRMGKKEGFTNKAKRACHDAWLKDKIDQRLLDFNNILVGVSIQKVIKFVGDNWYIFWEPAWPYFLLCLFRLDWFVHENVPSYPGSYVEEPMKKRGYKMETCLISPQRFGKPMNRLGMMNDCLLTVFNI